MIKNKTKIPEGWKEVMLSGICENFDNLRKPVSKELRESGKFPYYGATGIVDYVKDYIFDEELLLVGEDGANWSQFANAAYIIRGKSWVNNHAHVLKCKKEANILYLQNYLNFIGLDNYISGSTRGKLTKGVLMNIKILIPPLAIQNKIAEILGAVDEEIERVDSVIEKSERLKESQLDKIFSNKNKTVKLGECVSHVGSGSTPRGGERVYLREGVLFIRSQNVYFDGLRTDDIFYISHDTHQQMKRSKVLPNDILLNITGASIGRACIVPKNFIEANVNQHVCIIRTRELITPEFLLYFLQSKIGQNQIMSLQAGGNRQGLNFQQIRSFKITLLPLEEQKMNIDILSAIDNKILIYKEIKNNLIRLKKGLMADLLSGEVNA